MLNVLSRLYKKIGDQHPFVRGGTFPVHIFGPSPRGPVVGVLKWATMLTTRRLLLLSSGCSLVLVAMIFAMSKSGKSAGNSREESGDDYAQPLSSPVRTMLDSLFDLEDCDCSNRKACTFPTEIESRGVMKFPGGGQGDVSSNPDTWGSFDPVSKVPRLSCQDTVHHAHYTRFKLPKDRRKALGSYCIDGECIAPTNRWFVFISHVDPIFAIALFHLFFSFSTLKLYAHSKSKCF
jgi:hypothetical protein